MHKDALWARDVMEAVQATLELAHCDNDEDKLPALASTTASSRPPRGRSPITVATPVLARVEVESANFCGKRDRNERMVCNQESRVIEE